MPLHQVLAWRPRWRFGAVFRILSGSVIGQGLVLLASPILARLYDPAEFGLLVIFTAVVSMIGVLSTASLEAAILIPTSNKDAAAVAWASLFSVTMTVFITAAVGWFAGPYIAALLGHPDLARYWWLIALTVLALGFYVVLTEWMVRNHDYGGLARRNMRQGIGQVVTQVGLGLANVRPVGLLLGLGVGHLCGTGGAFSRGGLLHQPRPRLLDLVAAVRRYRRFPLVASWSRLINVAGQQVPLLLISVLYSVAAAGELGLSVRIIGGPAAVIGQAVYQVFNSQLSAKVRGLDRDLAAFIKRSVLRMLAIGVGPAALVLALGPAVFDVVFGAEWVEAGRFAQLMAIPYLAGFAITPISLTLFILERQVVQLAWDVTDSCSRPPGRSFAAPSAHPWARPSPCWPALMSSATRCSTCYA